MIVNIELEVCGKPIGPLRRAPGSAKEPVDVGATHGHRVVD